MLAQFSHERAAIALFGLNPRGFGQVTHEVDSQGMARLPIARSLKDGRAAEPAMGKQQVFAEADGAMVVVCLDIDFE